MTESETVMLEQVAFFCWMFQTAQLPPWMDRDFYGDLLDGLKSSSSELRTASELCLRALWSFSHARRKCGFIYVLKSGPYYKIGKAKSVSKRIRQISPQLPFPTDVFAILPSFDMTTTESALHRAFAERRANGEWFSLIDRDIAMLLISPLVVQANHVREFLNSRRQAVLRRLMSEESFTEATWESTLGELATYIETYSSSGSATRMEPWEKSYSMN